jgi:hypothetical protein
MGEHYDSLIGYKILLLGLVLVFMTTTSTTYNDATHNNPTVVDTVTSIDKVSVLFEDFTVVHCTHNTFALAGSYSVYDSMIGKTYKFTVPYWWQGKRHVMIGSKTYALILDIQEV